MLDELDPEIRRNFEHRGWLPLLNIDHPPLAILIREFYSNFSIHSNDSNTQFVKSWIQGSTVGGMYGLVSENCMFGILDISHINVDFMCGIHMWILSLYKGMYDILDALKKFI